ncbi:MAG: hypothetical protein PVI23_13715 [Maricaulaceae bacterium]|jgi:hypothetical protein
MRKGGAAALSASSKALLKKAVRAPEAGPKALKALRDDLADLSDEEIGKVWTEIGAGQTRKGAAKAPVDAAYRKIDKARRKLAQNAARFREILVAHFETAGAPAPETSSASLRALVEAFNEAGRLDELTAAAGEIVRTRSLAYDIT